VDKKRDKRATSVKPYDDSITDHWSLYDSMPYIWDPDLNIEKVFKIVSGNVIKAYRCKAMEPFEVKHE